MKKLLITACLLSTISTPVFAKVNNYISGNISWNKVETTQFQYGSRFNVHAKSNGALVSTQAVNQNNKTSTQKSGLGYGLSYTIHNVFDNNFLLGLDIHYDIINSSTKHTDDRTVSPSKTALKVKASYGADLHIGAQIDKLAVFGIIGQAINKIDSYYTVDAASPYWYHVGDNKTASQNVKGMVFGAGLATELTKNVSLFVKYTQQNIKFNQSLSDYNTAANGTNNLSQATDIAAKLKLQQFKLGVAYKF